MGVDVQCGACLSMAQSIGHGTYINSLGNHQCGVAVPERVEGHFWQPTAGQELWEPVRNSIRVDGRDHPKVCVNLLHGVE